MTSSKKFIEVVFNILYLLTIFIAGLYMVVFLDGYKQLWGIMSLVLAIGDSFHLIPRVMLSFKPDNKNMQTLAGWGKMATSITMSIFYLLLWHIGLKVYNLSILPSTIIIYILTLARIVLSLMPNNNWTTVSPYKWTLYRNIPFFLQGFLVLLLYILKSNAIESLSLVWVAILLSFLFYTPIILWGHKNKKLAILMLPKSVAYVWIVLTVIF